MKYKHFCPDFMASHVQGNYHHTTVPRNREIYYFFESV